LCDGKHDCHHQYQQRFRVGLTQNLTPIMGTGSGYNDGAVVAPIVSHTFYIGTSANTNEFGDPISSLFRKEGINAPVELVEGIEDLQVLYGVDTGGEALVPTTYVDASGVSDWRDVISVRVQLTANSVEDVGSSDADGILRRTFTQTVRLRNRLKKE
jgi:type IV pilus assembly protein PilW